MPETIRLTQEEIEKIKGYGEPCAKCGEPKKGYGITYATEEKPEVRYVFCGNYPTCYKGW